MEQENVFLTINKMLLLITGRLIAWIKMISIISAISENDGFDYITLVKEFRSSFDFSEVASWVEMEPQ